MKAYIANPFKFNSQSLTKQGPFWLAIVIPVLLFLITGFPVWKDYTIDFSEKSYETFLTISKLPLYLLSLSIPLVAIVSHIHRTIQTAEQIQLTINKNLPDSYYAQLKAITDIFNTLPPTIIRRSETGREDKVFVLKIKHPYSLFNRIYSYSSPQVGANSNIDQSFIDGIIKRIEEINRCIIQIQKDGKEDDFDIIFDNLHKSVTSILINTLELHLMLGYDTDSYFNELPYLSDTMFAFKNEYELKTILFGLRLTIYQLFNLLNCMDQRRLLALDQLFTYSQSSEQIFSQSVFDLFNEVTKIK